MPHRHFEARKKHHHFHDHRKAKPADQVRETPKPNPKRLQIVSVCIPHPEKLHKHGEDAHFIHRKCFGVFDGVGGWAEKGIDVGKYSKALARQTALGYHEHAGEGKSLIHALRQAVSRVRLEGSSTVCTAELVGNHLKGINVGDSGLLVVRDGKMEYTTVPQNKSFNHPYQVRYKDQADLETGDPINVRVREGDIVISASDGLWDNAYHREIVSTVQSHVNHWKQSDRNANVPERRKATEKFRNNLHRMKEIERYPAGQDNVGGDRLTELTLDITRKACRVAHSRSAKSPFSDKSTEAGKPRTGGKLDDITIIVARVVTSSERFTACFEGTCPSCRS